MITIKVNYECDKCGTEHIKQYACSNDNSFDLRCDSAFGIVIKNRVKLTAENECENCGHLQKFVLGLVPVESKNQ